MPIQPTSFLLPSAARRDVAVVVDEAILFVQKGLSDEHMQGMSLCMTLAFLLANEAQSGPRAIFHPLYRNTLEQLGWQARTGGVVINELKTRSQVDSAVGIASSQIGCGLAVPLMTKALDKLAVSPQAKALHIQNTRESGSFHWVNLMPVPEVTEYGLRFGILGFSGFYEKGEVRLGSHATHTSTVEAISYTLSLDRFAIMMEKVEPALKDLRQRYFEEIDLN